MAENTDSMQFPSCQRRPSSWSHQWNRKPPCSVKEFLRYEFTDGLITRLYSLRSNPSMRKQPGKVKSLASSGMSLIVICTPHVYNMSPTSGNPWKAMSPLCDQMSKLFLVQYFFHCLSSFRASLRYLVDRSN